MRAISIVLAAVVVAACSNPTKRAYEEATYGKPLEVPPDLTLPRFDEAMELRAAGGPPATVPVRSEPAPLVVLPDQANMYVARDGAQRWLVVNGEPAQVWPWVRDFLTKKGLSIGLDDPTTGIIETEWTQPVSTVPVKDRAENEDDRVYAVPLRDKFRIRFERGEKAGTTEIYVTHQGAELSEQDDMVAWRLRASDRELEAEMLRSLIVALGIAQEKAGGILAAPREIGRRSTLGSDAQGTAIVHIEEDFARAWRRVELVLDRAGYRIEDRDRSNGVFFVLADNTLDDLNGETKKSWWSKLFSSSDEQREYQIVLKDEGDATNIYVRNKEGEKIENDRATSVLKQLHERLQ